MAGYPGTPLIKKLGIKPDFRILLQNEPPHYFDLITPLPENIKVIKKSVKEAVDFIQVEIHEKFPIDKGHVKT